MSVPLSFWIGFNAFVVAMLALDLGVFHRKAHAVSFRESLGWSAAWIALALLFNAGLYFRFGPDPALEFLTGYLIEKSLSVDNIFVFLMIFSYFRVPAEYQHKVLFWGVVGALVLRAIFIAAGIALIQRFHGIIYLFGAFLVFTAIKMSLHKDKEIHPEKNLVVRLLRRIIPMTDRYQGPRFFVRLDGRLRATPLFLVLVIVETTDVIFAVDSIPAILAVTQESFLVYTSNVFAILGLRSLYFALAGIMQMFHFIHYALSAILLFVGAKMLLMDIYKIPIVVSLCVIAATLLIAVAASLLWPKRADDSHLVRRRSSA